MGQTRYLPEPVELVLGEDGQKGQEHVVRQPLVYLLTLWRRKLEDLDGASLAPLLDQSNRALIDALRRALDGLIVVPQQKVALKLRDAAHNSLERQPLWRLLPSNPCVVREIGFDLFRNLVDNDIILQFRHAPTWEKV